MKAQRKPGGRLIVWASRPFDCLDASIPNLAALLLPALLVPALLVLGAAPALGQGLQWEAIGPPSGALTCLHLDGGSNTLFAGSVEGFWYLPLPDGEWVQREDVGWIGRQVWSLTNHSTLPGRIITGRENAFFKGYLELSTDWGANGDLTYMSNGGSVTDVQRVPGSPNVFYACTWSDVAPGELLKSSLGGASWVLLSGTLHYAMTEIAIDPATPTTLYVSGSSLVTRSTDGGATWAPASSGLPLAYGVYCVAVSPWDPQLLLSSNDLGIYRSTDGGGSWNFVPSDLETLDSRHFAFSPADPAMVAAVTFSPYRFVVSTDSGLTWADWTGDFAGQQMVDLAFSEDGSEVYVASAYEGVFRATLLSATVDCAYSCTPPSGTVPFAVHHQATLTNLLAGQNRRIAGRVDVTLAAGSTFSNWRSGYVNVAGGATFATQWTVTMPALGAVIGENVFHLAAEDVTPSPFNQPPYAPSGDSDSAACTVEALAP